MSITHAFRRAAWVGAIVVQAVAAAGGQQPAGQGAKPKDHMEHRFDDPERYSKSFDDPARDAWQMPAKIIDALAIAPGQQVADIGAGTGYFTVRLARAQPAATVFAVDIEPAMIAYVTKRAADEHLANVRAVLTHPDSADLPQPVDLVLIVDVYHHLPNRVAYFTALRRSLKPSARVAIIDYRKDSPEGPPVEFRFAADQIVGELREAGFRLTTSHDFLPRQHFLVFSAAN
jgi:SAM-dependent methyltransferase